MPQFQSGGANDAISQFLMQREMANRQRMIDQLMQQRQAAEDEDRKRRIGLQERQFNADQERQTQQDAIAEEERQRVAGRQSSADDLALADRRDAKNQIGVLQMMTSGVRNKTTSPEDAMLMAAGEGVSLPMETLDPNRETRVQGERDTLGHQRDLERIAAQGTESRRTVAANLAGRQPGGGGVRGSDADDMNAYTARGQSRLLTAITDLEPQIGPNTVGTWRAQGSRAVQRITPGSVNPTVDFDAALKQITALIGFDELNQMRQASPTGGALGQVSERELMYLQSVAGTLDPNQSEAAFRAQLQKVKGEIERVVNFGMDGNPGGGRGAGGGPGPSGGGGSFRVIGKRPAR